MALDYKTQLKEIFRNLCDQQIDESINIVMEQSPSLTDEEKLEEMINLLVISGDSALEQNSITEENAEGATGVTLNLSNHAFDLYFDRLITLFPDISPNYLTEFCRKYNPFDFDQIVEDLTGTDYVKVEKDPIDVEEQLRQMLPNADPIYIRNNARILANRPPEELQEFIENAVEKNDYPTLQEYLKNQELSWNLEIYLKKFNVARYLEKVNNPIETYLNPDRKPLLAENPDKEDLNFALTLLYNQFPFIRQKEIEKIFTHNDRNFPRTIAKLKSLPKAFRHPRTSVELEECKNVELLKELSFWKHERSIRQYMKQRDERYRSALEEARRMGILQTCACCFYDELVPEECYFCKNGCTFCKECVRRGAAEVIGREETVFLCFADCGSEFDYSTLGMVLDSKTFQGICHRKQIEEIRNANIDGLETCPNCDFSMIPDPNDKIFKCANIECMAETCRLCLHKAHVPLRCNEIEYDEDVKMRTFIENKMTEALLRKCWKCSKQFYKDSGCNKMTCICGAKMCYLCGAAVTDYSHFNGGRCPLYTENLQELHLNRVRQGAESAKAELGINNDPDKLKFDPTRNIERDVI